MVKHVAGGSRNTAASPLVTNTWLPLKASLLFIKSGFLHEFIFFARLNHFTPAQLPLANCGERAVLYIQESSKYMIINERYRLFLMPQIDYSNNISVMNIPMYSGVPRCLT